MNDDLRVKHLNPRQGITTQRVSRPVVARYSPSVKHLNPRQGITTRILEYVGALQRAAGVKHLNPRQGITTPLWRIGGRTSGPHV